MPGQKITQAQTSFRPACYISVRTPWHFHHRRRHSARLFIYNATAGRGNIPLLPSARQPGDLIATFSSTGHTSEQVNLADISPPDSGHLGGGGPKIL